MTSLPASHPLSCRLSQGEFRCVSSCFVAFDKKGAKPPPSAALLLFSLSGSHFVALQSISLQGFGLCHAFGDHNVFLLGLLFPDGLLGECYEFRPSPR